MTEEFAARHVKRLEEHRSRFSELNKKPEDIDRDEQLTRDFVAGAIDILTAYSSGGTPYSPDMGWIGTRSSPGAGCSCEFLLELLDQTRSMADIVACVVKEYCGGNWHKELLEISKKAQATVAGMLDTMKTEGSQLSESSIDCLVVELNETRRTIFLLKNLTEEFLNTLGRVSSK